MAVLKIGDRVKVISVPNSFRAENPKIKMGLMGTVKDLDGAFVGVEFDEYMGGHNGSWNGKQGYCWYIEDENLEKIDKEVVNHPVHYTSGKVECIDAIESATSNLTGLEAVCTANVIKYVWRWKLKNGVEDLEKASWYLNKLIKEVKGDKNAYAEDGQIDEVEK